MILGHDVLNLVIIDLLVPCILKKMFRTYGMFQIRVDPRTGRDESVVARKMSQKPMTAYVQCVGCMELASGMLDRKHGLSNVKPVKQAKKWHLDGTSVAKAS